MRFINKKTIEINRKLSDLDSFTIGFVNILTKHTSYVIVSGYVAILLGRARASEAIDIIIPKIPYSTFQTFYHDLKKQGFYCLNAEDEHIVYSYLKDDLAIRFAKKDTIIPNIELKWIKHEFHSIALEKRITVQIQQNSLNISPLELQIAFKEEILRSPKDIEDAEHIRNVAKDHIDEDMIKKYKEKLHGFY
jgi:hypothetical protein